MAHSGDDGAMGQIIRIHPDRRVEPDPLWRELLGGELRALRERRGDRLVDVAARAGIAAVTGALGTTLAHLIGGISADLSKPATHRPSGPMLMAA